MGACVDVVVYSGLEGQYGSQRLHLQTGGLRLWRLRLQVGEDMHAWATSEWRVAVGPSRCIKFQTDAAERLKRIHYLGLITVLHSEAASTGDSRSTTVGLG